MKRNLAKAELRALLSIATGPIPVSSSNGSLGAMRALERAGLVVRSECFFACGREVGWRLTLSGMLLASRVILELVDRSEGEAERGAARPRLAKTVPKSPGSARTLAKRSRGRG